MTVSAHSLTLTIAGHALDVKSADTTLDEGWSPYAQVDLVCVLPEQSVVEALDPRGRRLRGVVTMQQDFGDSDPVSAMSADWDGLTLANLSTLFGNKPLSDISASYHRPWNAEGIREPTVRSFDLMLRSRVADPATGQLRVQLCSDEALLEDYKLVSRFSVAPAAPSVKGAVRLALAHIGAALDQAVTADHAVDNIDALIWNPGVSAWDYVYPLVQKAGLRLFADERRAWKLVPATSNTEDMMTLTAEHDVTKGTDSISLDGEWFDAVVLTYRWRDAAGTTLTAYDVAGDYTATKVYAETREVPYPGPGAAAALLGRKLARGRVLDVAAVSKYDASPGRALVIVLPDTPLQSGYASAVTWRFPEAEMTVKSRGLVDTPEDAWMFLPETERWMDSPADASWLDPEVSA